MKIVFILSLISLSSAEAENKTEISDSSDLCPSTASQENDQVSEWCKFWIQGIFLSIIGLCGIIGNLVRKRVI